MKIYTSTTHDGNMDFRFGDRETVEENRKKFFEKCGLVLGDTAIMQVEHLDKILDVIESGIYSAEALVTNKKNVPLMLLTADCFPCVIYDPVREIVALLHLGWRPTELLLAKKVVIHMEEKYKSQPTDLEVYFGPGVSKESYVTDILGSARDQCKTSGVNGGKIHTSGIDTYTSRDYFSHNRAKRGEDVHGRFATVVVL